jgi:phosphohistidine phosphatase
LVERLPSPVAPIALEDGLYLASEDVLLNRLRDLPAGIGTVMVIGHNDGMWLAAQRLAAHGKAALLSAVRQKFPTAALATLQADIEDWSALQFGGTTLTAFASPRDLD